MSMAVEAALLGEEAETVVIVEDDISVREALGCLLQSVGLQVKALPRR